MELFNDIFSNPSLIYLSGIFSNSFSSIDDSKTNASELSEIASGSKILANSSNSSFDIDLMFMLDSGGGQLPAIINFPPFIPFPGLTPTDPITIIAPSTIPVPELFPAWPCTTITPPLIAAPKSSPTDPLTTISPPFILYPALSPTLFSDTVFPSF